MDPYLISRVITPADPASIKLALVESINHIIRQAGEDIIDWGTTSVSSQYMINEEEGQELLYFTTVVRAMAVNDGV